MSDWTEKPLGTLCSIKTGKKDVNEGSPNGAYPFFTCSRDVHASDSYSFDTDAILIAGNGAVGDTKLYRGKFEAYQRTYVLDGFKEDLDFIFYVLKGSLSEALSKVVSGSTMPYIRKGDLERFPIPLPPLPEQKTIAHILSTVQRAIEAQERIIQTTTELKKALMHKLFTEGLRHEPQKQTEIGPVPESWEVVKLASLLREPLRNGHSARASNNGTGIRTLTLTAVTKRDFCDENTKLTVADPHRVRDMWLRNGDILIERANTPEYVGLSALYEGPDDWSIYSDLMIRVRLDVNRAMPYFVSEYLLTDPCRKYYQTHARSSAGNFPKIDQGTIEKTLIPLPSPDEQNEIAAALRAADSKLSCHRHKHATLTALFRTLLHQLMTAQIRVGELELSTRSLA